MAQVIHQGCSVDLARYIWVTAQPFQRRRDEDLAPDFGVEERVRSEWIARANHSPPASIPQNEREAPAQAGQGSRPLTVVGGRDQLGVRAVTVVSHEVSRCQDTLEPGVNAPLRRRLSIRLPD
jgi:hypothetical protein